MFLNFATCFKMPSLVDLVVKAIRLTEVKAPSGVCEHMIQYSMQNFR